MNIIIEEVSTTHYAALLDGEVLCRSKTPFLSAARVLLERGVPPETELTMSRSSGPIAMRSTVGAAAHWAVSESEKRGVWFVPYHPWTAETWMPFPSTGDAPGSAFERSEVGG